MGQVVCAAVVAVLVTLPGVCSPYLYARQPAPTVLSPQARPAEGLVPRQSVWTFPYKFEKILVISKKRLHVKVSDLCSADVIKELQAHCSLCGNINKAVTSKRRLSIQQRPLARDDPGRPRPLTDLRPTFVEVLAVVAVKIIMSTALASWFLVAGEVLTTIAEITGFTEIFGNASPLTLIFQALPLVEVLLRGSFTFDS